VSANDDTSTLDACSDDDDDTDEETDLTFFTPKIGSKTSGNGSRRTVDPYTSTVIDALVNKFLESRFDPPSGIRSLAGSDQTSSSSGGGQASETSITSRAGNGSGKKRSRDDALPTDRSSDNGHGEGNGDDPNKRQRPSPSTKLLLSGLEKRYACPYFKRNPELYGSRRSCIGPGWTDVHRVKYVPVSQLEIMLTETRDHLYKHHTRPIQCQRCWEEFAKTSDFSIHQNAEERCQKKAERIAAGFDKEQEKLLRSKKRFQKRDANDIWYHIYHILFPEDERIPNPCMSS
jgi:hypothetical protein